MPTIVICGTPGTGKSSLVEKLKPKLPEANYVNLSEFAIENHCTSGFDHNLNCHIIDDEILAQKLQPVLANSAMNVLESIHADHLDSEEVDKIFVLRTDTSKLFDRLQARGYSQAKIVNNVDAEIFQLIYDEAIESFGSDHVTKLDNNESSDLDANVSLVHKEACDLLREKPHR